MKSGFFNIIIRSLYPTSLFLLISIVQAQSPNAEYSRLIHKADSLYKLNDYKAASCTYSDAFKSLGWRGFINDRYNAACTWALTGIPDSAIFNLERIAFRAAYADISKVSQEPNFTSLHSHKKWKVLLDKIQSNADSIAARDAKLDKALIRRLDSLRQADQKWRTLSTRFNNNLIPKDSIDHLTIWRKLMETDSLNCFEARKIFYKYGFPNYDLVGEEGANDFWLLVQHQDEHPAFQDSVLVQLKIEADKGKASLTSYAYLIDRVKVNTGQLQIYGTQMQLNKDSTSYEPRQVVEPEKLNERRKSMHLNTIEDYTKTMNELYHGTLRKK